MSDSKRHKHADLIIAWANGAKIQVLITKDYWADVSNPSWNYANDYRIKPEPDVVKYRNVYIHGGYNSIQEADAGRQEDCRGVLKFTYDGETGDLKHVEIVK